jgi:hypothetical protein
MMSFSRSWAMAVLAICFTYGECQTAPVRQNTDIQVVNGILGELQGGLITGFTIKRLTRMGDGVAASAIQAYSLDQLKEESMAKTIAEMISISFSSPSLIQNDGDKTPKMSKLLLCYLRDNVRTTSGIKALDDAMAVVDQQLNAVAPGR